jgi:hypothetical protein
MDLPQLAIDVIPVNLLSFEGEPYCQTYLFESSDPILYNTLMFEGTPSFPLLNISTEVNNVFPSDSSTSITPNEESSFVIPSPLGTNILPSRDSGHVFPS